MALLTRSGRTAMAASLKNQSIYLAWGRGDPAWESSFTLTLPTNDSIQLPHAPVKNVTFTDTTGILLGNVYHVDSNSGLLSRLEGASLPENINISYTTATASESLSSTGLLDEIGRRVIDEVSFCQADPDGFVVTPTGRFSKTDTPTNQLYFHCTFDFEDASDQTIRELGLFIGTEISDTCPPGQRYFLPSDLKDPGILLVLENTVPLIQTAATREAFSFVITL